MQDFFRRNQVNWRSWRIIMQHVLVTDVRTKHGLSLKAVQPNSIYVADMGIKR